MERERERDREAAVLFDLCIFVSMDATAHLTRGSKWWSPVSDRSLRSLPPSLHAVSQATALASIANTERSSPRKKDAALNSRDGIEDHDALVFKKMGWHRRDEELDAVEELDPYVDDVGVDVDGGSDTESDLDVGEELDKILEQAKMMEKDISKLQLEVRNTLYRSITSASASSPVLSPPAALVGEHRRAIPLAADETTNWPQRSYSLRNRGQTALDNGEHDEIAFCNDENAAPTLSTITPLTSPALERGLVRERRKTLYFGSEQGRRQQQQRESGPLGDAANALLSLMVTSSTDGRGGGLASSTVER